MFYRLIVLPFKHFVLKLKINKFNKSMESLEKLYDDFQNCEEGSKKELFEKYNKLNNAIIAIKIKQNGLYNELLAIEEEINNAI
jgi:hypothetical protein